MRQGDIHARDQNSDNGQQVTNYIHDGDVLDKILSHVGNMGRYQKLLFVVLILFGYFYAFVYFVQMFITVTPENYWCRVPELSGLSMELRRNLSAPGAASGEWDHCQTFEANWSEVLATLSPPADGTPLVACQHGWEFEFSDIPYETVASERGWVCDRASNVPTAQSIFFAGAVFGVLIFGWVADRFGRVPAIMVTNVVGAIGGVGTIFTTTVWDFIVCRFLVGMSFNNCFMIVYVLVLEYVGLKYRTMVASLSIAFSFTVAAAILPWMAYYIADWRIFTWATSMPMFIALLAPWVLPESVKWLVSRGRIDEAVAILRRFEVVNRTKIPDDVMNEFMVFSEKAKLEKKQSILVMFKSVPLRWTMLFLILVFSTSEMVFDGLTRLSDSFDLSFFAVVSFYGVFELFSCLSVVVVLDRFGRRMSTSMSSYACGFILLIALFVPDGIPRVALAVVARFFIAICYTAILQWSTEIIPTPFRATGLSLLQMISFAMNMITPFIVYSQRLWSLLPIVIFTVLSVFTASMSLLPPETNGLPLPQTRADGEKIVKEHSLRWRRNGTEANTSTINAN